jgi:hypothetical protein
MPLTTTTTMTTTTTTLSLAALFSLVSLGGGYGFNTWPTASSDSAAPEGHLQPFGAHTEGEPVAEAAASELSSARFFTE